MTGGKITQESMDMIAEEIIEAVILELTNDGSWDNCKETIQEILEESGIIEIIRD